MKKALSLALFFSGAVALILILLSFFPKYQGSLIFLFVFLLGDLVLWFLVSKRIFSLKPTIRSLLTFLFWLPAASLAGLVFFGFFRPFIFWDNTVKAILLSLLMMTIAAKMIPLLISLLGGVISLLAYRLFKIRAAWLRWIELSAWITAGLFWLTLGLGMITWVYEFKVTRVDFPSPRVPSSFNNFRIVQFSDLHLGNWTCPEKLKEAVDMINELKPDLIVFTGDMFTFSTAEGKGFSQCLKQLHAPYGIDAIMGNHDYGDYVRWENTLAKNRNLEDLHRFYKGLGWNLLLNSSIAIKSGADSINIIGVQNWGANRRFQRYGDIDKAETGINRSCFCLLLSHDPSYWDSIICRQHPEIDLTLSGHTHGGQFGIESGALRWSILSWSNPLWGGFYTKNKAGFNSSLYVNRGLGTVGYAGRVGIKPEITLIILHSMKKK
ncbi:MAG: metallophosphoesterase [Bacteroidota bacterium]